MQKLGIFLFLLCISFALHSQRHDFIARGGIPLNVEPSTYNAPLGLMAGGAIRFFGDAAIYMQFGYTYNQVLFNDDRVKRGFYHIWDFQFGIIPYKPVPFHICLGTFTHRYHNEVNPVYFQNYLLIPGMKTKYAYDGFTFGLGYSIKKNMEIKLSYETEPIRRFKVARTANYLRLEFNYSIPFYYGSKAVKEE